jgi:hypothetical protein
MREIRPSGSEGGAGQKPRSYLYHACLWRRAFFDGIRRPRTLPPLVGSGSPENPSFPVHGLP